MKFASTVALTALLAAPALAGPHGHSRVDHRDPQQGQFGGAPGGNDLSGFQGQGQGQGQGPAPPAAQPTGQSIGSTSSAAAPAVTSSVSHSSSSDESTDYEVNENWAGAVQETAPASASWTYVQATFTMPTVTPTAASSSSDDQAVSLWVGIDGATGGNSIWQAGVDTYVQDGETTFFAWYEWYPSDSMSFSGIDFSEGDVVVATVEALSSSSGVATLENLTTGQNATATASAPSSDTTLTGTNAEWIVEDLSIDGDGLTFIDFGEAYFSGCVAKAGGNSYGLDGAALYAVEDSTSSTVQAVPDIVSSTELKVTYE
ncbi:concanavalin A-like lectin/glucanase [Aspergillus heteromorphus CBS 117.55]|uniref:Concanavalin A-like lectin/glucanase n=1 Tax=Aspergillus heteromorphus CBS 117.55 TaxID=1448321 RepID=A0A317WY22_9EURO|nr:concanavalin A-like lectin/glucanase [Aspergillus heteromorphus CBS 117.55]PWY91249.1 concanavalin A-like lectin/glucanase [Aspergillus heteromorphus CBS 117.55]